MGNQINPRLTSEQIFRLIDKNGSNKIDDGDNMELASMFGLKKGDRKIVADRVKDYDKKASLFSQAVVVDQSVTVNGNKNKTIVIRGDGNEATISLPKDENATYTPVDGSFDNSAQFALTKKGLDPEQILAAGFNTIEQIVDEEGNTKLILKSEDGYNLEISDVQEGASIARDENGNLVLDGVHGKLDIQSSTAKSHEVILSNIYEDNSDVPTLQINNKSGVPLTKTYPCDSKGNMSYDAARALTTETGFPGAEAANGGFTHISITENPLTGSSNIHMESNKHGFIMDVDGNVQQPEGMTLDYSRGKHELSFEKLAFANIDITEDGSDNHRIDFSNVNNVHVENKTRKPVHIHESVLDGSDRKEDMSSFTYNTETNFDTFQRETRKKVSIDLHSDGTVAKGRTRVHCDCGGRHSWSTSTGSLVGAFDLEIDLGSVVHQEDRISLAPGEFIIQPKRSDYDDYENTMKLKENNERNIGSVTMFDYITTEERLEAGEAVGTETKIGRSGRDWIGLHIDNHIDQSVTINGDGNSTIVIFGDNNIAHIDEVDGRMAPAARTALYENYHLDTRMLEKAGFTQVDFVRNDNGEVSEIVLTNKDGTKLTMPSDEAFLFSEQMNITRDSRGVYHVSNLVGKLEGSGMKIDCTNSNVDLTIIDNDPANGYLVYNNHDDNQKTKDACRIRYIAPEGTQARAYKGQVDESKRIKLKQNTVDITYPAYKLVNGYKTTYTKIT